MKSDQPYHMWNYWKDDKGFEEAVEVYYKGSFKNDHDLKTYYRQYKDALKLIEMRMEQLADEEEDYV